MLNPLGDPRLIDSLFFLFLGSSGTIGANISSCRLKKKLETNPYLRHFLFFVIIYFTNSIIQDNAVKGSFINTFMLYSMFIVLMRNDYRVIVLVVALLFIHKIITQHMIDLKKNNESKETIDKWETNNKYIIHAGVTIMVVGFLYNIYNKSKKFGASFSILEYIFQNVGCKN